MSGYIFAALAIPATLAAAYALSEWLAAPEDRDDLV